MHDFDAEEFNSLMRTEFSAMAPAVSEATAALERFGHSMREAAHHALELADLLGPIRGQIDRMRAMNAQTRLKLRGKNWRAVKLPRVAYE